MKVVILAGGQGSRLWPFSKKKCPKQFLSFDGKETLLQKTTKRFLKKYSSDKDIVIVTNKEHQSLAKKQINQMDKDCFPHIIAEPCRKNTMPAIILALKFLEEIVLCSCKERILIVPSDHIISPEKKLLSTLKQLEKEDIKDNIITFGIKPTRPDIGYGYIEIIHPKKRSLFKVKRFVEKPKKELAEKYFADDNFFWNTGMFYFSIGTFFNELKKYSPEFYKKVYNKNYSQLLKSYKFLENISIDYSLMEKTPNICLCLLSVFWSDIGCWESIYEVLKKDNNFNVKGKNIIAQDTKNSLIIGGKRLIMTCGIEDLVIVDTDDAILIAKRQKSQNIKPTVKKLLQ